MTKPIKKTSSRDKAELVEVQGSTEAEASSHRSRKRCRTAKIVEASSDQPQKGGRMTEVVKPSSDQTKKRGPKNKLSPEEKRKRKRARDNKRYHKKEDTLREIREMKPQLKVLEDRVEEMLMQMGNLKGDLELVKADFKKMESLIEKFLQKELTDDDLKSLEIPPLDNVYLGGEEYRSMVLGSSEHISNGKNWMTDSEYPPDFFDLVGGMSKQEILAEFTKTREHLEELRRENEELNSRVTDIETMISLRAMTPKK